MSGLSVRALALALLFVTFLLAFPHAMQPPHPVRVASLVSTSGPVASIGRSSRAAITAAVRRVNEAGGVELSDGSRASIEVTFHDDHCSAPDGVSLLRTIAATDAVMVI